MSGRPRSTDELVALVQSGHTIEFLLFWGHQPQQDGSVGRGCLSQWWVAAFTADGLTFPTVEHYMMWRKAMLFGHTEVAGQILAAPDPRQAKSLGRQVAGFDQQIWDEHRYEIVVGGNMAKFAQHDDLARFLLSTGERVLVEASPIDRIWGIGLAADDSRASSPREWRGRNLLGFALMDVRCAQAPRESLDG